MLTVDEMEREIDEEAQKILGMGKLSMDICQRLAVLNGAKRALNEFSATGNINTMANVENALNGAENASESEFGDIRPALNRYNTEKSLENFERLCVEIEEFCKAVYAEIDSEEKKNFFIKTLDKIVFS